jgi:hypothetical protein
MGNTIDGREPPIRLQLASECERGYEFGAGPRHARYRRFGFVSVPRTRRVDYLLSIRYDRRSRGNAGFASVGSQHCVGVDDAKPVGAAEGLYQAGGCIVGLAARPIALQLQQVLNQKSSVARSQV